MDLKKLAGQAGQFLTRAVQYTEEKLGSAEKTEFDHHYDSLIQQYESTKLWTEKIMNGAQSVAIPNPGNRVEDMIFEKIEKKRPNRLTNVEYLGLDMVQAGNDFGPSTAYGSALLKVGGAQQRMGFVEREFVGNTIEGFIQPLHKFLDTEIKTIARERRVLDNKRLDLDACKSRLRKARSMESQPSHKDNTDHKALVSQAEAELRKTQAEFDRQTEIVKLLLEGMRSSQASHLRHLNELVDAQVKYFEDGRNIMVELQKDLTSLNLSGLPGHPTQTSILGFNVDKNCNDDKVKEKEQDETNWRKAEVVCDYEATTEDELSLKMDELVLYSHEGENARDFVNIKKGTKTGRVPKAYLQPLDD